MFQSIGALEATLIGNMERQKTEFVLFMEPLSTVQ